MRSKGYENTKISEILEAGQIGKGQFYYYFSSKHELGLDVIDYFFESFNKELIEGILCCQKSPKIRFNEMLEYVINDQKLKQAKSGCVFGNFALEMSEHDESFRSKISGVFEAWIEKLKLVLEEMIKSSGPIDSSETHKLAQGVVAMLEGGILMMKNKQDINVIVDVAELARGLVKTFVQAHSYQKEESNH